MAGRNIPNAVKRAVRKQSGFGCVICGLPIYQYEHIDEFAKVRRHDAPNLVLLCPNHHQEKTSRRLSKDVVRHFAANPYNLVQSITQPHKFLMMGDTARFELGTNIYDFVFSEPAEYFSAISMHGKDMMGLRHEAGHLLLDLAFSDSNGKEVLVIRQGEMCVSTGVWDYRIEGPNVLVHSSEFDVGLEMSLTSNGVNVKRGTLYSLGHKLVIEAGFLTLYPGLIRFHGGYASRCRAGLSIN